MQGISIAPGINIAPTVGSLAQRVAPIIAAGAGASIVFHQQSSLNSPSSLALARQRSRLQPLRAGHVPHISPVVPRQNLYMFDEALGTLPGGSDTKSEASRSTRLPD